jgi:pyridinium-3,5-biscarboxylic acid mononucleotide synthase
MDDILEALAAGHITVEDARIRIAQHTILEVEGVGRLDAHREARTGIPEIVLAEGKTPDEVRRLVTRLIEDRDEVLVSRLSPEAWLETRIEDLTGATHHYDVDARFLMVRREGAIPVPRKGLIGIITGGTSDLRVAREAQLTAEALGAETRLKVDCGVAAPQRLGPALRELLDERPDVLIVAAGREGTLATIVSGLVPIPVIGLPVSVGYGAGGQGHAALHAMLQSCSPLAVVNIDAGVIAGSLAARIARLAATGRKEAPEKPATI